MKPVPVEKKVSRSVHQRSNHRSGETFESGAEGGTANAVMQSGFPADQGSIIRAGQVSDGRGHNFAGTEETYNSISQLENATPEVSSASEWRFDMSLGHHEVRLEAADPGHVRTAFFVQILELSHLLDSQILQLTTICCKEEPRVRTERVQWQRGSACYERGSELHKSRSRCGRQLVKSRVANQLNDEDRIEEEPLPASKDACSQIWPIKGLPVQQ